jgi:hypothetical protein
MGQFGVYTLANDVVYDQVIALINSIRANVSPDVPICIIPFDNRLHRVKEAADALANVTLFDNQVALDRWDNFLKTVWAAHPQATQKFPGKPYWGLGHNRKFAAFDGDFDKFVFYDADSLAMQPLTKVIDKLNDYDFVFDDWEHKKPRNKSALNIDLIEASGEFQEADIRPNLHCSSFFGSKRGIFDEAALSFLQQKLVEDNEIRWVPRWWDDAFLFTYMTLRSGRPQFNFTLSRDGQDRTGNCANADPFIEINQVLHNQQGAKPIHRIHYMSYSSADFSRLCQGENMNIPHQDVFLHYRFLKQPEQKPKTLIPPKSSSELKKFLRKVAARLQR